MPTDAVQPGDEVDEARDAQLRTSVHHERATGVVAFPIAMGFAAYRPCRSADRMSKEDDNLAKVAFRVGEGDDVEVETPWARKVGVNTFVLDNLPWFAYGISAGDTFEAIPAGDGLPEFTRVLEKSGNRTVRVILKPSVKESPESQAVLDHLVAMGCEYEGMNGSYFAVNIPPRVEFADVCAFLTEGKLQWEHADPTYAELHPDEGAA